MKLGLKILLCVVLVLVTLAVVFLAYTGLSALFTGSGFVQTMEDTWCTIFGLTKNTVEAITETPIQPVG